MSRQLIINFLFVIGIIALLGFGISYISNQDFGDNAQDEQTSSTELPESKVIHQLDFETIELAKTPVEQLKGLQHREGLCDTCGVWFQFSSEQSRVFWMPNVDFSIDIIFLNSDSRIVTIASDAKPNQIEERYSSDSAKYVLEVPAGYAEREGLQRGDTIDLEYTTAQFIPFDNSFEEAA